MGETVAKKRPNWLAPALVAALAGACYYWLAGPLVKPKPETEVVLAAGKSADNLESAAEPAAVAEAAAAAVGANTGVATAAPLAAAPLANPVAMEYVAAYQQGQWDDIVRLTCWMQDRLGRLRSGAAGPEEIAGAVETLQARSRERSDEANQLREEGVEDQYVLAPGAKVEAVGMDSGRDDLERPAKDRTWARITYPDRPTALRDQDGLPIRWLVVGINVSEDGLVLKANVVGNLDIDVDSIQTHWVETSKETGHGAGNLSQM